MIKLGRMAEHHVSQRERTQLGVTFIKIGMKTGELAPVHHGSEHILCAGLTDVDPDSARQISVRYFGVGRLVITP